MVVVGMAVVVVATTSVGTEAVVMDPGGGGGGEAGRTMQADTTTETAIAQIAVVGRCRSQDPDVSHPNAAYSIR